MKKNWLIDKGFKNETFLIDDLNTPNKYKLDLRILIQDKETTRLKFHLNTFFF